MKDQQVSAAAKFRVNMILRRNIGKAQSVSEARNSNTGNAEPCSGAPVATADENVKAAGYNSQPQTLHTVGILISEGIAPREELHKEPSLGQTI